MAAQAERAVCSQRRRGIGRIHHGSGVNRVRLDLGKLLVPQRGGSDAGRTIQAGVRRVAIQAGAGNAALDRGSRSPGRQVMRADDIRLCQRSLYGSWQERNKDNKANRQERENRRRRMETNAVIPTPGF